MDGLMGRDQTNRTKNEVILTETWKASAAVQANFKQHRLYLLLLLLLLFLLLFFILSLFIYLRFLNIFLKQEGTLCVHILMYISCVTSWQWKKVCESH